MDLLYYLCVVWVGKCWFLNILYIYPRHQPSYSQMIGVSKHHMTSVWIGVIWWRHPYRIDPHRGFNLSRPQPRSSPQANSIESWAIQSSRHLDMNGSSECFSFLSKSMELLKINLRDFFLGIKAMMHMFLYIFSKERSLSRWWFQFVFVFFWILK